MKNILIALALVVAGLSSAACPKAPPNLSPAASLAYYQMQVDHTLDMVRDFAVDANKQGFLSDATTKAIVTWHQTAVQIVATAGTGWPNIVKTSLDTVVAALPAADKARIQPYVPIVDAILSQVQ